MVHVLSEEKPAGIEQIAIGSVNEHGCVHSTSRWLTAETFARYLDFISGFVKAEQSWSIAFAQLLCIVVSS
jgi:hypothetical protein